MGDRIFIHALVMLWAIGASEGTAAQLVQRNAQYWLSAEYNNTFYNTHPRAARSFYAAHYAHFGVYEVGMNVQSARDGAMVGLVDRVRRLVDTPPRFEPPIDVVAPAWARISYRTLAAMDWTHHLHEQLYDILTDDRVVDKQAAGERAIAYYLNNRSAALSTRGYGHVFMLHGGPWSGTFPVAYPVMNGILWAFHWHHAAIYEALMEPDSTRRRAELDRVLQVFTDSVLISPPEYMPLTAEVAPTFGAMFPAAAHIFDNLHMLHDVVNDIMVDPTMSTSTKSEEIDRMLDQMLYVNQDSVIPPEGAHEHGDTSMPAVSVPTLLPTGRWLPQGHPLGRRPDEHSQQQDPETGGQHDLH